MVIELADTERGFARAEFIDRYGSKCSIQESSLADEAAIWLGVDRDFNELNAASGGHRMHLTQGHVRELLPLLQRFVETGGLR